MYLLGLFSFENEFLGFDVFVICHDDFHPLVLTDLQRLYSDFNRRKVSPNVIVYYIYTQSNLRRGEGKGGGGEEESVRGCKLHNHYS